jgi:hypothetical protein
VLSYLSLRLLLHIYVYDIQGKFSSYNVCSPCSCSYSCSFFLHVHFQILVHVYFYFNVIALVHVHVLVRVHHRFSYLSAIDVSSHKPVNLLPKNRPSELYEDKKISAQQPTSKENGDHTLIEKTDIY